MEKDFHFFPNFFYHKGPKGNRRIGGAHTQIRFRAGDLNIPIDDPAPSFAVPGAVNGVYPLSGTPNGHDLVPVRPQEAGLGLRQGSVIPRGGGIWKNGRV